MFLHGKGQKREKKKQNNGNDCKMAEILLLTLKRTGALSQKNVKNFVPFWRLVNEDHLPPCFCEMVLYSKWCVWMYVCWCFNEVLPKQYSRHGSNTHTANLGYKELELCWTVSANEPMSCFVYHFSTKVDVHFHCFLRTFILLLKWLGYIYPNFLAVSKFSSHRF